mgnify:FL=1
MSGIAILVIQMQVFYKFHEDLFGKQLSALTIIEFSFYAGPQLLLGAIVPIVLLSSALLYRKLANAQDSIRALAFKDILVAVGFGLLFLIHTGFIEPATRGRFMSLLYDIKSKAVDEALVRSEPTLFSNKLYTRSLFYLMTQSDSTDIKKAGVRTGLAKSLKMYFPTKTLDSILATTDLSAFSLNAEDVKTFPVERDGFKYPVRIVPDMLENASYQLAMLDRQKIILRAEIWKRLFIPLSIPLLFLTGLLMGILTRKIHVAALVSIVVFVLFPAWYYGTVLIQGSIADLTGNIAIGYLSSLVTLALVCIALLVLVKKSRALKTTS